MNYRHGVNMVCSAVLLWASTVCSMEDDTAKKFVQGLMRGSIAGVLEVAVDQPLVTIKNDLQQGRQLSLRLSHLYRGGRINAGSMAPITAMQMSSFELFKRGLCNESSQDLSESKKLLAASLSGAVSAGVSSPSELLMIQQQKNKLSLLQTMRAVKTSHGSRAFLRGMMPTMVREGGFTAGYLAGGPALSHAFVDAGLSDPLATVMGGTCAGLVAAVVTQPVDTMKTRLQADLTKNAWDVCTKDVHTLGAGLSARAMRIVMATTLMSAVNKKLQKMME